MESTLLIFWIGVYLILSIVVWLYAGKKVKTENDYLLAGRKLPLYITIATVFATWFGSETVLGTSSTFMEEWLIGIMADPFGASLCLILVWVFFAKPMYKLWITTLWDFYKLKYGRTTEILASLCILVSYIGWIAAQIVALWVVFEVLSGWMIPQFWWSWLGASIVLIYTFFWGMWSVALTDFVQMIMIVVGMIIASFFVAWDAGWMGAVATKAFADGKFNLFPDGFSFAALAGIFFAIFTMWFWSIPQQDVFQRVLSARDEKTAVRWSIIGWSLYLVVAFLPIMLAYSAYIAHPEIIQKLAENTQMILPALILEKTPLFVQIMFFGALISAIMSTASATLLAPSALITENIIKPFLRDKRDKHMLWLTRFVVLGCFMMVMAFVTYKYIHEDAKIFEMVENAYKITLAGVFFPLVAGVFIKKTHTISGLLSLLIWVWVWLAFENIAPEWFIPPQFWWLAGSIVWFIFGHFLGKVYGTQDEK